MKIAPPNSLERRPTRSAPEHHLHRQHGCRRCRSWRMQSKAREAAAASRSAFAAAVLGGIGNLRGALLGGLLLGVMENYGQTVFGTAWRDVVAFVLLVLVLLIRPTGILGESLGKARV